MLFVRRHCASYAITTIPHRAHQACYGICTLPAKSTSCCTCTATTGPYVQHGVFIPNRRQWRIAQHTAQLLEACDQGRAWCSNEETKSHCPLGLGPERRARKQSTKCLSGDTLRCSKQCRTRISAAPQCHPLHSKDGICEFVAQRGLLFATAYHDVLIYLLLIITATKVLPAGRTTDPLVRHY
jgi:hypothetical protein